MGERGNRVAVRAGRKLDDDDSPALPTVQQCCEYGIQALIMSVS